MRRRQCHAVYPPPRAITTICNLEYACEARFPVAVIRRPDRIRLGRVTTMDGPSISTDEVSINTDGRLSVPTSGYHESDSCLVTDSRRMAVARPVAASMSTIVPHRRTSPVATSKWTGKNVRVAS